MIKKFDLNQDGKIDDSEREAAEREVRERRLDMLDAFDTDENGRLDAEEREDMRAAIEDRRANARASAGDELNRWMLSRGSTPQPWPLGGALQLVRSTHVFSSSGASELPTRRMRPL